jgi:DNA-binding NtrC family response regulator
LNVISIKLPPLRDRKEDIPLLIEHFLKRFCEENAKKSLRFTNGAMKLLMDYDWPGNVRELENVVERAVVLATSDQLDAEILPESLRGKDTVQGMRLRFTDFIPPLPGEPGARTGADNPQPSLFQVMEEVERRIVLEMLERTSWNQTEAAERFQVPLSTLNQKIKRLGIEIRRRGLGRAGAAETAAGK